MINKKPREIKQTSKPSDYKNKMQRLDVVVIQWVLV
jgi:hypothetical protein